MVLETSWEGDGEKSHTLSPPLRGDWFSSDTSHLVYDNNTVTVDKYYYTESNACPFMFYKTNAIKLAQCRKFLFNCPYLLLD